MHSKDSFDAFCGLMVTDRIFAAEEPHELTTTAERADLVDRVTGSTHATTGLDLVDTGGRGEIPEHIFSHDVEKTELEERSRLAQVGEAELNQHLNSDEMVLNGQAVFSKYIHVRGAVMPSRMTDGRVQRKRKRKSLLGDSEEAADKDKPTKLADIKENHITGSTLKDASEKNTFFPRHNSLLGKEEEISGRFVRSSMACSAAGQTSSSISNQEGNGKFVRSCAASEHIPAASKLNFKEEMETELLMRMPIIDSNSSISENDLVLVTDGRDTAEGDVNQAAALGAPTDSSNDFGSRIVSGESSLVKMMSIQVVNSPISYHSHPCDEDVAATDLSSHSYRSLVHRSDDEREKTFLNQSSECSSAPPSMDLGTSAGEAVPRILSKQVVPNQLPFARGTENILSDYDAKTFNCLLNKSRKCSGVLQCKNDNQIRTETTAITDTRVAVKSETETKIISKPECKLGIGIGPGPLHMVYLTVPGLGQVPMVVVPPSDLKQNILVDEGPTQMPADSESQEERIWKILEESCNRDLLTAAKKKQGDIGTAPADVIPRNDLKSFSQTAANMFHMSSVMVTSQTLNVVAEKEIPNTFLPKPVAVLNEEMAGQQSGDHVTQRVNGACAKTRHHRSSHKRSGHSETQKSRHRIAGHQTVSDQSNGEKKPPTRRESLSPSTKSKVESGSFGSLQSIQVYYQNLDTTSPQIFEKGSDRMQKDDTGCEDKIPCDVKDFSDWCAMEMPMDLSKTVRKKELCKAEVHGASATDENDAAERLGKLEIAQEQLDGLNVDALQGDYQQVNSPISGTALITNNSKSTMEEPSPSSASQITYSPSDAWCGSSSGMNSPSSLPDSQLPPKKRKLLNCFYETSENTSLQLLRTREQEEGTVPSEKKTAQINPVPSSDGCSDFRKNLKPPEKSVSPDLKDCYFQMRVDAEDVHLALKPDEDGDLPLHIAVAQASESIVEKFVEIMSRYETSVDSYNNNRKTALHLAVISNQPNLVKILLKASASPNISDRNGNTSIHLAVKDKHLSCLMHLLTESRYLVNLDARNYDGLTALHLAAESFCLDAARILLEAGASVDMTDGKNGRTPLHCAAGGNDHAIAKLLLSHGAKPSTTTYSGCTPAQVASAKSYLEMAKMLERNTFTLSNANTVTKKVLIVKEQ